MFSVAAYATVYQIIGRVNRMNSLPLVGLLTAPRKLGASDVHRFHDTPSTIMFSKGKEKRNILGASVLRMRLNAM